MQRLQALVVDHDPTVRAEIARTLEEREIRVFGSDTPSEAMKILQAEQIRLLFVDVSDANPAAHGLLSLAGQMEQAPVVFALGAPRLNGRAVFAELPKPMDAARLEALLDRGMGQISLLDELSRLRDRLERREGFAGLVGRSSSMLKLRAELERLSAGLRPVWFSGETGSGRAHSAQALHDSSPFAELPFARVRCDRPLSESPFSMNPSDPLPKGTLYLGEIEQLRPDDRQQLLDRLQPILEPRQRGTLRVMVGSNSDPLLAVEQSHALEPVYRRLAPVHVPLLPLRQRSEDIVFLSRYFVRTISEINHLPPIRFAADTMRILERYGWPGNVRELRDAVEHAAILAVDGEIRPRDLPEAIQDQASAHSSATSDRSLAERRFREVKREVVEAFEVAYLKELLERHGGNVTSAARKAGMLRSALQRLLRKYSLRSADFRQANSANRTTSTNESAGANEAAIAE